MNTFIFQICISIRTIYLLRMWNFLCEKNCCHDKSLLLRGKKRGGINFAPLEYIAVMKIGRAMTKLLEFSKIQLDASVYNMLYTSSPEQRLHINFDKPIRLASASARSA